jgi:hypothetical protein
LTIGVQFVSMVFEGPLVEEVPPLVLPFPLPPLLPPGFELPPELAFEPPLLPPGFEPPPVPVPTLAPVPDPGVPFAPGPPDPPGGWTFAVQPTTSVAATHTALLQMYMTLTSPVLGVSRK